ncbi:HAMP domain-containing sensor histidine kinase (plasmid) [Spirosoma sp. SC4-14]|uniref:sensor histidine kinase n=1 Tax=Spirosoma sp. SC4-14 TaxID=3128900 RepID=UPI0030D11493
MKLLHKTTLYLLLAALPIALAGIFVLNGFIHRDLVHEIDELLANELTQVQEQLGRHPPNAADLPGWDPNVQITLTLVPRHSSPIYIDTVVTTLSDKEPSLVRMLLATHSVGNRHYQIALQQSYLEFDEIAQTLSVGVIVCFLVVLALLVLADILVTRRIWQPFYGIIRQLKQYRIDGPDDAAFPTSDVYEFTLLSQSFDEMSRRSRRQYAQQKQFTDNASHEMQTPLSVLSFELDLLLQSERLNEADLDHIQRSQQAVKRLSAMNQSLLLLARIDNQQFIHNESVALVELVDQIITGYSDYATHKGITLKRLFTQQPSRLMNRQLADVLFSNLIKNAIRHGDPNSSILVQIGSNQFMITNQGDPLPFPVEQLFDRFVRNQALPQSTGLGLALVKEIAEQYGMKVHYSYLATQRRHLFQVDF